MVLSKELKWVACLVLAFCESFAIGVRLRQQGNVQLDQDTRLVTELIWIGNAPYCNGKESDCTDAGYESCG